MSPQNLSLQRALEKLLPSRRPLKVLEAGCGSTSHLPLDASWHLSGIDLSQRQLDQNLHLQEKILGNLETYEWDSARFDLIVCWDVIEHLPNPNKALLNMLNAMAPGGILVLAFPHLHSIKGYVTKLTPFWVHIAFYRFLLNHSRSVAEDHQFPTYLRRDILPRRIIDLSETHGLECCYHVNYEGPVQCELRQRNRLANSFFSLVSRLGLNDSDCMIILRRPLAK